MSNSVEVAIAGAGESPFSSLSDGHNVADRELDEVYARNDHGEYDAPVPAERCARDDVDERSQIRCRLEELMQTQREIVVETVFEGRKRAQVAARREVSVHNYDNRLQAAFRTLRDSINDVAHLFTNIDGPRWYDRIEQLSERHAAAFLRRVSGKEGDRSNSEGDRSNCEHDRGKMPRAGAA